MSIKHVFLTGGNGFIGSHLIGKLLDNDKKVSLLLRKGSDTSRIDTYIKKNLITIVYETDLEKYFSESAPDIVVHLATCYKKHHSAEDIQDMISANITLPTKILELSKQYGVHYFINTGTFFEYDFESKEIITEKTSLGAYNLYASTKLAFDKILQYYNISSITLRLFSPYGEKDNVKLIPLIIKKLDTNEEIQLIDQSLCFTYIDDITSAYIESIEYIKDMPVQQEIFNIASTTERIPHVVQCLEDISGKKLKLEGGKYHKHNEKDIICDTTKAEKALGWKQQYSIEKGLGLVYNNRNNDIS